MLTKGFEVISPQATDFIKPCELTQDLVAIVPVFTLNVPLAVTERLEPTITPPSTEVVAAGSTYPLASIASIQSLSVCPLCPSRYVSAERIHLPSVVIAPFSGDA